MNYVYDLVAVLISFVVSLLLVKCILSKRIFTFVCVGFLILLSGWFVYLFCGSPICYSLDKPSIVQALNQTLSSFWPSRGGYDREYQNSWCYWLFHLLAIMYVGAALVAILGKSLCNYLSARYRLIVHSKETNVFWDFCDEARWMASTIPDKSSVLFALREESRASVGQVTDSVSKLLKDEYRWVYASPGRAKWLSSAMRHFFLGSNGHENVSGAAELIRSYHGSVPIKVFVRVSAMADDDVLYAWADKLNKEKAGTVEIIVMREESIVSSRFLVDHPMLDCPKIKICPKNDRGEKKKGVVEGQFRVLIIGFGNQGERLMDDMICDAQFVDSEGRCIPIAVDVVDGDESSFGWFKGNCREACDRFGIAFSNLDVESEHFWDWLKKKEAYSRIIVCTGDDKKNISIAHDISRFYKLRHAEYWRTYKKPNQAIVYARVRDALIDQYVVDAYKNDTPPFLTFGNLKSIYSYKDLCEGAWWEAAIWVNGLYCGAKTLAEARKKWIGDDETKTSSFDKESSFASAFHQRNLMRLIGYTISAGKGDDSAKSETSWNALLNEDEKKKPYWKLFARIEHLRWMAFHFVRGVECWRPDVDELKMLAIDGNGHKKVKPNMLLKENIRHVHAALKDFDDLPTVDKLFAEVNAANGKKVDVPLQDKDYALTTGFDALRKAGFIIEEST